MPKRRNGQDSSDDELYASDSPPLKRAKPQGEPSSQPPPKRRGKKRGKASQDDDDDSSRGSDGDEDTPSADAKEEDEKSFEDKYVPALRNILENGRKVHGSVADHGIIESIEMHQFMCHKYLTFTFGPQINFIIGHNGSGKSAVLSAITVALGGKATSTGRGSGLKSFIREGQGVSEVTISIKNRGEEAYKPQEYGKSIVITRRFTKEGSSTWKIKSKDGRIISTKKDELSAICDHMNIQVDNPMNVLTQDAARQFLSASQPSDKYKFFLRGTQLSQLSDEYDTCLENITVTNKVLQQKKEVLPDLKTAFKEATARFEEAAKAREQRHKADELKKELAWAHVATKEEELRGKVEEVAKMSRRLPKIQQSLDKFEADFQTATQAVEIHESEYGSLGDIEHLNQRKKELQEELRINKSKIADFTSDEKQMNISLQGTNRQIEDFASRIAEEAKKMESRSQAKRDEKNRELEQARQAVQDAEAGLKEIAQKRREQMEGMDKAKTEGLPAENERDAARKRVEECKATIERCKEQEKNKYVAYGNNIEALLAQIKGARWQGQVPVGPLGLYVKVKDPQWAPLLRTQLGQYMTAFAITDARDRVQLKRLLEQSKNPGLLIIISERDMFDYSQGEPPSDYLTVLRALEISDPYVLRLLINSSRIERTFLARVRSEAQDLLKTVRNGGTAWTCDWFRVMRYPEGGGSSQMLQPLPRNDPKQLMFTDKDAAGQLRHWYEQAQAAESQYKTAVDKVTQARKTYDDCRNMDTVLMGQEKRAHDVLRHAKHEFSRLQEEANEELPVGIASLQDAKAEAEAERESILTQFRELQTQKNAVTTLQPPLLEKLNAVKKDLREYDEKRRAIREQVETAVAARIVAQNNKANYTTKLAEEQEKVKGAEDTVAVVQQEFMDWTAKAEEYCERYENPRKVEEVERNLKSVQAALKEREKKHGATVEEMTIEVNRAKANLDTAQQDLKNMTHLIKVLRSSLLTRLAKWQEFRRHIALRCKLVFQYHLSNRGYYGKVLFDHSAGTLQLKVQTDEQATQGGGSREKDPRSLSGGEKSFSTICLLLSLWESIGCPLRCLDEFDVFMDAVNRRVSMMMMIDTANASDKKQYILITPQDMHNVKIGPTVRVHRMTDPERGQGTLAFS